MPFAITQCTNTATASAMRHQENKGVQIIEVNLKDYDLKKYEKRVVEQFEKVNGVDGLWLMPAYVPCDHLGKCIANKNGALAGKCSH